jgi:hypothetical protein
MRWPSAGHASYDCNYRLEEWHGEARYAITEFVLENPRLSQILAHQISS